MTILHAEYLTYIFFLIFCNVNPHQVLLPHGEMVGTVDGKSRGVNDEYLIQYYLQLILYIREFSWNSIINENFVIYDQRVPYTLTHL